MSREIEEWRPVVGYEGLYEVSDWGNVRSLDRVYQARNQYGATFEGIKKGRILTPCYDKNGYCIVCLHKNGIQTNKKVHRLVALAFLPNPDNKPVVGHTKTLDNGLEDKAANEAWNLAWMTVLENNVYGTLPERQSALRRGDKCYNFGRHLSEETKAKLSQSSKRAARQRTRNNLGHFVS